MKALALTALLLLGTAATGTAAVPAAGLAASGAATRAGGGDAARPAGEDAGGPTPRAHVFPFGATSETALEVHVLVTCPYVQGVAKRTGDVIRIKLTQEEQCIVLLAVPSVVKVPIDELLPPGRYRVEVRYSDDALYAETEFFVRNAGPKPFEIHPSAAPVFGGNLPLRLTGVACGTNDCSDVEIRVGGTKVGPLTRRDGWIEFLAPPQTVGLHDVTVQRADFVEVSPAALYSFNGFERSIFERILFPVLEEADGAFGSKWVSEAVISNPRPWYVENVNAIDLTFVCITYPCGERLSPASTARFDGRGFPRGVALLAPRAEAPDLALGLRVRDVSRSAQQFGTRIPVVREKDMVHGEHILLLDVPLDPRYRVKVRIYAFEPFMAGTSGLFSVRRGERVETSDFVMTRCEGDGCTGIPAYAEIDLPSGEAGERAHITIDPPLDATAWAFATVTNNETQQVTIITP